MDRSVVYKATSNNGPPVIPEHVTREVLEICKSDSARCLQIVCFLKYRMTKYDPLIKLKCVKLCHRLLEKEPHGDIRKLIRRDLVDSLKILSHFSPAKMTDDRSVQVAREIRVEAEKVLALVFDEYNDPSSCEKTPDEPPLDAAAWAEPYEVRELGAGEFEPSGLSYSDRLRGIGSSDFSPSRQRKGRAKDSSFAMDRDGSGIKSFVNMISSNITANLPEPLASSLANMTAGLSSSLDRPSRGRNSDDNNLPAFQRRSNTTTLGNTGYVMRDGPRWGGSVKRSQPQQWIGSALKAADQVAQPEPVSYGGEYEQRLLDRICAPSGAKLTPSAADLEAFCRDCSGLDLDTIVVLLFAKMDAEDPNPSTAWKSQLRCLYVLEALLKSSERIVNCQGEGRADTLGSGVLAIARSRQSYGACIQVLQRLNRCQRIASEVYTLITGETAAPAVVAPVVAQGRVSMTARVSLLDLSGDEEAEKNGKVIHQQEATAASSDVLSGIEDEEEEESSNFRGCLLKRDSRSAMSGNLLDDFYSDESHSMKQTAVLDPDASLLHTPPCLATKQVNLLDL